MEAGADTICKFPPPPSFSSFSSLQPSSVVFGKRLSRGGGPLRASSPYSIKEPRETFGKRSFLTPFHGYRGVLSRHEIKADKNLFTCLYITRYTHTVHIQGGSQDITISIYFYNINIFFFFNAIVDAT